MSIRAAVEAAHVAWLAAREALNALPVDDERQVPALRAVRLLYEAEALLRGIEQ